MGPVRGDSHASSTRDESSFIPRLWARARLDHLLAQHRSPEVQARVIALSEEYQLVTPYASFLVLESETDRARMMR